MKYNALRLGYARDIGAQPQLLQAQSIQFARGIKSIRRLKLLQRFDGACVPFPARVTRVIPRTSQGRLDFGNAVGCWSHLAVSARSPAPSPARFLRRPRGG